MSELLPTTEAERADLADKIDRGCPLPWTLNIDSWRAPNAGHSFGGSKDSPTFDTDPSHGEYVPACSNANTALILAAVNLAPRLLEDLRKALEELILLHHVLDAAQFYIRHDVEGGEKQMALGDLVHAVELYHK